MASVEKGVGISIGAIHLTDDAQELTEGDIHLLNQDDILLVLASSPFDVWYKGRRIGRGTLDWMEGLGDTGGFGVRFTELAHEFDALPND